MRHSTSTYRSPEGVKKILVAFLDENDKPKMSYFLDPSSAELEFEVEDDEYEIMSGSAGRIMSYSSVTTTRVKLTGMIKPSES